MTESNTEHVFEEYAIGMVIEHAVLRTIGAGKRAMYDALYPVPR